MTRDTNSCVNSGRHLPATRHTKDECPVGQPTFADIAEAQGWNAESRETILMMYIDGDQEMDLPTFAQARADEENAGASGLPDLTMDVHGEYYGNAYPESADFRVRMSIMVPGDRYLLTVETADGTEIDTVPLGEEEVDGIQKIASTDHSLEGYADDWTIPVGIDRTVHWDLSDAEHFVRLNEQQIDEIAQWLRFATGQDTYEGDPENWEY
jgi:hypothetical protein